MREQKLIIERRAHIDLIKFIAILMVIIYHLSIDNYNFVENPNISYYINYLSRAILSTCVPLFFFVNGYLLLNKEFDLKKHIRKTLKLIILTIIWGIIGLFFIMNIEKEILSIKDFIQNLLEWKPVGWINHLWYMGALTCIYAFFPLIKNVYDNNKKIFIYFLVICFIFTFVNTFLCEIYTIIESVIFKNDTIYKENIFGMFNPFVNWHSWSFVYFALGGLLYNLEDKIYNVCLLKRNLIAAIGMILSSILLYTLGVFYTGLLENNNIWDSVFESYDTIFTLINVICIYILSLNYKRNNKLIHMVSSNTLGIYFIHNIFIRLIIKHISSVSFFTTKIGILIAGCLVLIICLLTILIMKKNTITKKLVSCS